MRSVGHLLYGVQMHNDAHDGSSLLTTAEVAQMLGRHVATVSRMVARGDLTPTVKVPGKTGAFLFSREAVEAIAKST